MRRPKLGDRLPPDTSTPPANAIELASTTPPPGSETNVRVPDGGATMSRTETLPSMLSITPPEPSSPLWATRDGSGEVEVRSPNRVRRWSRIRASIAASAELTSAAPCTNGEIAAKPPSVAPGVDARNGKSEMPASIPLVASPRTMLAINCVAGLVSASGTNRPNKLSPQTCGNVRGDRLAECLDQRAQVGDEPFAIKHWRYPSRTAFKANSPGHEHLPSAFQSKLTRRWST